MFVGKTRRYNKCVNNHKLKYFDDISFIWETACIFVCMYPSLIDRHPEYDTDTHLGDRPPTPTQQRNEKYKLKASRKKSNLSAISD